VSLLGIEPVVLVTGISAAGKSTISDLLARRFDHGVHINGDVFRRMVVSGRQEMSKNSSEKAVQQLRLRYRLGAAAADAYHEAGFSVVLQDVTAGDLLSEYVALIKSRPLFVVVLCPRADVVASREAARPKNAYASDQLGVAEWDAVFRRDTPHIGMWLDSSDQRPEETVEVIINFGLERAQVA
jgi:chloramphenicol 3-O-phosphotransferase